MQNRYVGDVGDFGKYALLRRLTGLEGEQRLRLGVVWCLFPNEHHNGDGRHIAYLYDKNFKALDEPLIETLREIIQSGQRDILSVISRNILDASTISCHQPIIPQNPCTQADRLLWRSAWIERCFELTPHCDLVFFDPDNGLAVNSIPKNHQKAGKYIYWDELALFWKRGHALLVYHHLNRMIPAAQQIRTLMHRISKEFDQAEIVPLVFRRGSARVFWLLHHGDLLGQELQRRAENFLGTGWLRHFRPFGWPNGSYANTPAS